MKKNIANEVVELLRNFQNYSNDSFILEKSDFEPFLTEFHHWADGNEHLGRFLIRKKKTGTGLWLVFNVWNPNLGYYLVIYPESRSHPVIEIHKYDDGNFIWNYQPRKQDGQNLKRKEYFNTYFGTLQANISVPQNTDEVKGFLKDIFDLTEMRLKADDLSKNIPSIREVFVEGRKKQRLHYLRERNSALVSFVKEQFKVKHGKLFCQICNFDFEQKYGTHGKDFIEAHHLLPVSELDEKGEETKPENIILVCSNCHRMIHRTRPWLKFEEMKKILK